MAMTYYEKENKVYRALEDSVLEKTLIEEEYTKGTSATSYNPDDLAVPELSQKAVKTKTSARKEQLIDIDQEVSSGYTPATIQTNPPEA